MNRSAGEFFGRQHDAQPHQEPPPFPVQVIKVGIYRPRTNSRHIHAVVVKLYM